MKVVLKKGEAGIAGAGLKPGEWGISENGLVFVRCQHDAHVRVGLIHILPSNPHRKPSDAERYWLIDDAGNVKPSIFMRGNGCDWHVFARLEGWEAPR